MAASACLEGQSDSLFRWKRDSLRAKLSKDSAYIYRNTVARPYLRLERRNSFVHGFSVNFVGLLAGVNLHEKHIFSGGFYSVDRQSKEPATEPGSGTRQAFARLNVIDFSYQLIFLSRRYIQFQWPLEIGYGSYKATLLLPSGTNIHREGHFVPIGTGIQFIIRPLRGAGVSLIVGYRYTKEEPLGLKFNGMYSAFGLWVDARQLYRDLRYLNSKKKYRKSVRAIDLGN